MGGFTGDSGAYIRDGMRALVRLGAPPEALWPYKVETFDAPPDFVATGYAQNFAALRYVRLKDLTEIKAYIRAGFPVVFGFTVFPSIDQVEGRWLGAAAEIRRIGRWGGMRSIPAPIPTSSSRSIGTIPPAPSGL